MEINLKSTENVNNSDDVFDEFLDDATVEEHDLIVFYKGMMDTVALVAIDYKIGRPISSILDQYAKDYAFDRKKLSGIVVSRIKLT